MKFNKNDIEFYLLTKQYDALTTEELAIVSEAVASKEEYQSLKQLLLVMEEAPAEIELAPNPKIKEELVTAFEKARWRAEVGVGTKPKVIPLIEETNKKRGGFFWLSIAASLTLLIGLFLNRETFFMPQANQLALVKTTEVNQLQKTQNNKIELEETIVEEETALEIELEERIEEELIETITANEVERLNEKETEPFDFNNETEKQNELIEVMADEELVEEPNFRAVNNEAAKAKDDRQLTKASVSERFGFINADKEINAESSEEAQSDTKMVLANESISLKEDKDLISLLYTAL